MGSIECILGVVITTRRVYTLFINLLRRYVVGRGSRSQAYAKILTVEVTPSEIAEHLEGSSKELDITPVLGRRY